MNGAVLPVVARKEGVHYSPNSAEEPYEWGSVAGRSKEGYGLLHASPLRCGCPVENSFKAVHLFGLPVRHLMLHTGAFHRMGQFRINAGEKLCKGSEPVILA
jgi:hypothetical protein